MKVMVGMSGGVDSSVAAYLLKEAGHDVVGLSLLLFEAGKGATPTSCCSLAAIEGAAETARIIGIPHVTLNARSEFIEKVIEPFVRSYQKGLTPNPCVLCNRYVKFPLLMREARERGMDHIATGHYARVEHTEEGSFLKTGADRKKDQSYFLYALRPEELGRLVLPLGGRTKDDVRAIARQLDLPASSRPESQEICFIEGRDYASFVCSLNPEADVAGPIKDMDGKTIGTHRGIQRYTVGQRKGLGISSPHPLYVTRIAVGENALYVGPRESALEKEFSAGDLNWLVPMKGDFTALVKIRSTMKAQPASIRFLSGSEVRVEFDNPQFAPAPGQSAVFYEHDTVIGGGTIRP